MRGSRCYLGGQRRALSVLLCSFSILSFSSLASATESERIGSEIQFRSPMSDAGVKLKSLLESPKRFEGLIKEVSFIELYRTASGRKLVYLKLNGVGDGAGMMMEVREGGGTSFDQARLYPKGDEVFRFRDASAVDALKIDGTGLTLEGPVNSFSLAPKLRLALRISALPGGSEMLTRVLFAQQAPRGEFFEYRGLTDQTLSVYDYFGKRVVRDLAKLF